MLRRRTYGDKYDPNTMLMLHLDGNMEDSSKFNRPATGAYTTFVEGAPNMGLAANISNSNRPYYDLNKSFPNITIEFYLKVTGSISSDWAGCFGTYNHTLTGSGAAFRYTAYNLNGWIAYLRNTDGVEFNTGWMGVLTLNTWYYFTITYDGSNMRVYKDGVLVKTVAASGDMYIPRLTLGQWSAYNTTSNFPAVLDELRISDIVRYTSDFTPPNKPLR